MKSPSLRHIYISFFLVGLFFIPFNSYKGISFLGEYSKESAALFFIAGCAVLGLGILIKGRVAFPIRNGVFCAVLFFLFWCLITGLFNINAIAGNDFKGITGFERFVRQSIALWLIGFFFLVFYINALSGFKVRDLLHKVRGVFLASLVVVTVYGALETLILVFGKYQLTPVLALFDYFPFTEVHLVGKRISSVSYEVPFLAIYLITICGWMLSYVITSRGVWRFLPAMIILVLTFFAGSRTGLVVITVQYLLFFFVLLFFKRHRKEVIYLFSGIMILILAIVAFSGGTVIKGAKHKLDSLNFEKNLMTNISNRSRFGMQYASFQVFKENPIVGVGFGQLAYDAYKYYPAWAVTRNYEFRLNYKNQQRTSFPPSYNIYLRIMAECGIIGLLFFLGIQFLAIYRAIKMLLVQDPMVSTLGLVTLVSVVGLSLNWLQIDTFRIFGFWLCIAILTLPLNLGGKKNLTGGASAPFD